MGFKCDVLRITIKYPIQHIPGLPIKREAGREGEGRGEREGEGSKERGEGSGDRGGGKRGEKGREAGIGYPPVHPHGIDTEECILTHVTI